VPSNSARYAGPARCWTAVLALGALLAFCAVAAIPARAASCLSPFDRDVRRLDAEADSNASKTLDDIIARADAVLHDAKNGGRDRARIAEESLQAASTAVRRALHAH